MSDIPPDAYRDVKGELRSLARVIRCALGVILAYWANEGLAPAHPYRQAVTMIDGYLKNRYGV